MNDDERALAFGDIVAEILFGLLFGTDQIEHIVLDLERETRIESKLTQAFDLLFASASHDRADRQRDRT